MIIIKIILAILITLTVVNVYWGLFFGEDESILTAGILCFFIVEILIMIPIISNTADKAQDDSSTVCEEVVSESIEKETSETVVNETEDIITGEDDSETEEESIVTLDLVTILHIIAVILLIISMVIMVLSESGFSIFVTSMIMIAVSGFIEAGKGFIIPAVIMAIIVLCVSFGPSILNKISDFRYNRKIMKKEKASKTEQDEMGFSEESFSNATTEKKTLKNLAASDSKVEYILWAVNYLDENGKADNTRKLKNYYIPEILKAQEQFKKIKSFGMDEMTTEAKKHYKKIISLAYSVAKAEVKKAASEILMDMDCNADVCEDIYKKDGYSSMREEIEKNNSEKHMSEKKKEKTFHARSIDRDTLIFWTKEE